MIGEGEFNDQINRAARVVRQLGLLEGHVPSPNSDVGASMFRGLTYRETWEKTYRAIAYNFILTDQSLIHFTKSGSDEHSGGLNFSYLECPIEVQKYEDFCAEYLKIDPLDEGYEEELAEYGDLLRPEYEQYVNTCDSRPVTPIRYDYAPSDYMPGRHPASHIHFGFQNHIRVATKRILKPVSFVLLIIRQRYPAEWIALLELDKERKLCRAVRQSLDKVHENYWNEPDLHEIILK